MVHALVVEAIGADGPHRLTRLYRRLLSGHPVAYRRVLFPEPWVARIVGICPRYGLEREFLRSQTDYTHANSTGSRGVRKTFWLHSGEVYEVCHRLTWRRVERYFCRVDAAGERVLMTREEVLEWLDGREAGANAAWESTS